MGIIITFTITITTTVTKLHKNGNLSWDEHLHKINPYLKNIIIDLQNYDAWKIQLTIVINFMSSKDGEEDGLMLWSSDSIKLTPYSDANDVNDQRFSHFVQNIK